jgi:hypothetical protein
MDGTFFFCAIIQKEQIYRRIAVSRFRMFEFETLFRKDSTQTKVFQFNKDRSIRRKLQ